MHTILLLGDSLVADYDWQSHLTSFKTVNLGVPGATSGDLLSSLPKVKNKVAAADVIMIMIGTNDLLSGLPEQIVLNLKTVLVQLRHDYPNAEILVNSLFPMDLPHLAEDSVENLNSHIEALTAKTGCCYLDTHRRFLESDKQLFQEDGVHLTDSAYSIWARAFLEYLAFLIEND